MKNNYTVDEQKKVVYAKMSDLRKKEVAAVNKLVSEGYKLIQNKESGH